MNETVRRMLLLRGILRNKNVVSTSLVTCLTRVDADGLCQSASKFLCSNQGKYEIYLLSPPRLEGTGELLRSLEARYCICRT